MLIGLIPDNFVQSLHNQRENHFGREDLVVTFWWFNTVFEIREIPRGTKYHWVNI